MWSRGQTFTQEVSKHKFIWFYGIASLGPTGHHLQVSPGQQFPTWRLQMSVQAPVWETTTSYRQREKAKTTCISLPAWSTSMFIRPQACVCPSNQTSRASKEDQQTSRPWQRAKGHLRSLSVPCPRWEPVQDHLADCCIPMGSRNTSPAGHRVSGSSRSRKSQKHTKAPNIPAPRKQWREKLNGSR